MYDYSLPFPAMAAWIISGLMFMQAGIHIGGSVLTECEEEEQMDGFMIRFLEPSGRKAQNGENTQAIYDYVTDREGYVLVFATELEAYHYLHDQGIPKSEVRVEPVMEEEF